ncbi:MAG: hypothetical protein ACOCYT_00215 [Chloroflexota bacterium]
MTINWERTLPVIVSILIIIAIAVLRQYSKTLAAIVAVMPINIPLGMWIVYAGSDDKQTALIDFSSALFVNIIPTLFFMLTAWQLARAGYGLVPTIAGGYAVWAVCLGLVFAARAYLT